MTITFNIDVISSVISLGTCLGLMFGSYKLGFHIGYKHGYNNGKTENQPNEIVSNRHCHIAKSIDNRDYHPLQYIYSAGKIIRIECYHLRADDTCKLNGAKCECLNEINK